MPADRPNLRVVLNTRNPDSAAAVVCIQGLARQLQALGCRAVINDWSHYAEYDVAIFMANDADCEAVRAANPQIKIGVADPKPTTVTQAREADFCIVGSIEQREVFLQFNRNQFIYYMVPEFESYKIKHEPKDVHRIFYHGNKVHLTGAYHGLVPALNEIGKRHPIEFNAIYNVKSLGKWNIGRPDPRYCHTRDLQWYPNCYKDYFAEADIGVVQNLMPWRREGMVRRLGTVSRSLMLESPIDHLSKYKSSANAGRAFVFGYFGIPVIADAIPSACDAIVDGHSGRLVLSAEGWYDALEELIRSPERREFFASNFREAIEDRFSPYVSAGRLLRFLDCLEIKDCVGLPKMAPSVVQELGRQSAERFGRYIKRMFSG